MERHVKVGELVKQAYISSTVPLADWMWDNHVQVVAHKAEELSRLHSANTKLAVAGAWLHDFGDAFVNRHDKQFDAISEKKSRAVLKKSVYTPDDIEKVINTVIKPHECRKDRLPQTLEGKILTTADAYAHFMTSFYTEFCWMHIPENKTYPEFIDWVSEKLERDYHSKIFFDEVRKEVTSRYQALKTIFSK